MAFKCREAFHGISKEVLRWFPSHMNKGILNMQRKLKTVDCIIEIHDARIPFSGRNPDFRTYLTAAKPHVLVLNKIDLADLGHRAEIEKQLLSEGINCVTYTNCKDDNDTSLRQLVPTLEKIISGSERYNRIGNRELGVMIIGVPNVGKSSLINRLRHMNLKKGKATVVGAIPGITKSVLERIKISEQPKMYLLDTPGVTYPKVGCIETGLRLAVCGTLKDHLVGEEVLADYLLYWLNRHSRFEYVDYLGLDGPCDDVRAVLLHVAIQKGDTVRIRTHDGHKLRPNWKSAASHILSAFRSGKLGRYFLDDDLLAPK